MSYLVVGTAGHIDHGKSSLVKVLSGMDPDRLKEEKKRGITIELGFAYLQLPGNKTVAIVDVPGHERFIKNMLAGVGGIDLAMLIIAADEGIMPQTREHFDILRLLELKKIIVVITKTDLVDAELVELLQEEIVAFLAGTGYEQAPILTFSAVNGAGKEEILRALSQAVEELSGEIKKEGIVRLPIDRIFTLQGFGTVVTGTLFSGKIAVGDQLFIPIKNSRVRVRNLQVHNKFVETARVGQRVAVNLAGVEPKELERGDLLTEEGRLIPTQRLDVSFYLLKTAVRPLQNFGRIRFHQGTSETIGRVLLWDREELLPGEKAYVQLVLEKPVVVQRDDKYVLRSYSPLTTIGGGKIIEPLAHKHKRKDLEQTMEEVTLKAEGSLEEVIYLCLAQKKTPLTLAELARQTGHSEKLLEDVLKKLVAAEKVVGISLNEREQIFIPDLVVTGWEKALYQEAQKYLQGNPLEPGIKKELLRSRLFSSLNLNEFTALLKYWVNQQKITLLEGLYIAPYGLGGVQGQWLERIQAVEKVYQRCGWQTPNWKKVEEELHLEENTSAQLLRYLLRTGWLVQLTGDLYLPKELLLEGQEKLQEWLKNNEDFTVAQARDLWGTTRKIAVPFLEYLDRIKFTVRVGDKRVLGK